MDSSASQPMPYEQGEKKAATCGKSDAQRMPRAQPEDERKHEQEWRKYEW
jgi:hypothetical protein